MPIITSEFPNCCGAIILKGFPSFQYDSDKKPETVERIRKELSDKIDSLVKKTGLFVAIVNKTQMSEMEGIFRSLNFRLIGASSNPNMGDKTTIYMWVFERTRPDGFKVGDGELLPKSPRYAKQIRLLKSQMEESNTLISTLKSKLAEEESKNKTLNVELAKLDKLVATTSLELKEIRLQIPEGNSKYKRTNLTPIPRNISDLKDDVD